MLVAATHVQYGVFVSRVLQYFFQVRLLCVLSFAVFSFFYFVESDFGRESYQAHPHVPSNVDGARLGPRSAECYGGTGVGEKRKEGENRRA